MCPPQISPGKSASRRILFISHNAQRTGAPVLLLAFLKWLKRNTSHEFAVLFQNGGPLLPKFAALAPAVNLGMHDTATGSFRRRVYRWLPFKARRRARRIRELLSDGAYDVVYSNSIVNGNILQLLADYRLPTITHVHELGYWIQKCGEQNLAQVKRCTSEYIAVSQAVKDYLTVQCGLPAERITLSYGFIEEMPSLPSDEDRHRAREALGIPQNAFVVGGCGAEYWRKGRDLVVHLLQAIRRRQTTPPVHFVWIGRSLTETEKYEMEFDLEKAGVHRWFHTTGEVPDPALYYPAFDLFALLSRDDPFPLVCLETASIGIPILCFEGAGGMPEFVEDNSGFVVPYLDVDAMAEKAVTYFQQPEFFSRRGTTARNKVRARHTLDHAAPILLEKIEALCVEHSHKPMSANV